MENHEFSTMVRNLSKNGQDIINQLTPDTAHLLHMTLALAGEVGELIDTVKRHAIYGGDLNIENMKEELGDIEFYLEGIRQAVNLSRGIILKENMRKLSKRYPKGTYSDEDAHTRKDKEN